MIDTKKIEQIARQVHEAMPKGIREFGDDVEKKIRQVLQAQLTRMDLVNREEFDVQTQVLLRTREKLAALEQRLAQLESQSASAPTATSAQSPLSTQAPVSTQAPLSTQAPVSTQASAPAQTPASSAPATPSDTRVKSDNTPE